MRLRVLFPALFLSATCVLGLKLYVLTQQNEVDTIVTGSFKGAKDTYEGLKIAFENMSALEVARLLDSLEGEELIEAAFTLKTSHLGDVLPLLKSDKARQIMSAMLKKK
jgi:Mg/Co/Ni transporter MgtE